MLTKYECELNFNSLTVKIDGEDIPIEVDYGKTPSQRYIASLNRKITIQPFEQRTIWMPTESSSNVAIEENNRLLSVLSSVAQPNDNKKVPVSIYNPYERTIVTNTQRHSNMFN